MLIHVTYTDDRFDYVKDFMLESLIQSRKITKFRRSSGWVEVGSAAVRKPQPDGSYTGVERRGRSDRRLVPRGGEDRRNFLVQTDGSAASETVSTRSS